MQGDILFTKSLDDKLFFVNVTREYDNEILSVTNSPKKTNNIKNKLEKAKEIFYISPELRDSSAHKAFTGVLSSTSRDNGQVSTFTANPSEPNANSTTKDLKQTKELERAFLLNDKINENALKARAVKLPKKLSFKEFKEQFDSTKNLTNIKTPIGDVNINILKSYEHLFKNTYKENRKYISGAFLHTLTDPLFIVKQEYTMRPPNPKKDTYKVGSHSTAKNAKNTAGNHNENIILDSYVFYKPFINENGLYHLASFAISKNGELLHKTFYDIKALSKLKKLIKGDLLYLKND